MQKIILDFLIKNNSQFYVNYGTDKSYMISLSHELADLISNHLEKKKQPALISIPVIERYEPEPPFTPTTIIKIVGEVFGVDSGDIRGRWQFNRYVEPRHLSFYFIRTFFPRLSYREIGLLFTGRGRFGLNHATIIKAIEKVKNLNTFDKVYLKTFKIIEAKIKNIN